jgi:hypothetical protein
MNTSFAIFYLLLLTGLKHYVFEPWLGIVQMDFKPVKPRKSSNWGKFIIRGEEYSVFCDV